MVGIVGSGSVKGSLSGGETMGLLASIPLGSELNPFVDRGGERGFEVDFL